MKEAKVDKSITTKQMLSRLNKAVNEAGSQKNLADSWGIPYQNISNAITGYKLPTKRMLEQLNLRSDRTIHYRYFEGVE